MSKQRVKRAERTVFGEPDWIPEFAQYLKDGVLSLAEFDAEKIEMTDDQRRRLLTLAGIEHDD